MSKKEILTQENAKESPAGGVVVGKRDGQTMIYDDASVGGYFVGKLHSEGGIKMINKSTGQPLEVQGAEVIITAPAVADRTKREFEGKMMTNREILSEINKRGGGVSFAEGGDVPTEMQFSGNSYKYGGKTVTDHDIAYEISKCGCEHETLSEGGKIDEMPSSIKKKIYTADGERKITPVAISILTNYVNSLPQTKDLNTDSAGNYTKERQELHQKIIDGFKDELICIQKEEPIAILMGGSPASGKSTFLRKYAPYLLKEEILKVDADEIRSMLPEYHGYNASQTHLETKDIVNTLLSDKTIGIPCKYDIIYDGTMNSTKSYLPLISLLKSLGYKIFIVYIDRVPEEVVKKRALERYKKSGRFVPMEIIDDFFSKGKTALEELKSKADGYMIIDGSSGDYNILEKKGISLPKKRLYSKLGEPLSKLEKLADGGHLAKGMSLKKIAKMHGVSLLELNKQIKMGLDAESEHTSNVSEQLKIVKDHLYENPNYYTLLKKAGLKKGGEIKESLVKDAKDGNSPSRDLNNYNDLMDVEADGAVGGDSGIYANGGALGVSGLPLVDYVEIIDSGIYLKALKTNDKYYNFEELKKRIAEEYKLLPASPIVRGYVTIQTYDSEGNKLVNASSYVANQKNTVKNFNPYTGNASNLEKSLSNSRPVSFKKADWSEWFSGKKSVPSKTTATPVNLVSGIYVSYPHPTENRMLSFTIDDAKSLLFTLGNLYQNSIKKVDIRLVVDGKILDETISGLTLNDDITDNWRLQSTTLNPNVANVDDVEFRLKKKYPSFDFSKFIGAPSTSLSLTQGEIDMFTDIKKYVTRNGLRVADKGLVKDSKTGVVEFIDKESNKLHQFITYVNVLSFEKGNKDSEEIIQKYLEWEKAGSTGGVSVQPAVTPIAPTLTKKPIDLKNTKIWIGDNPELSRKVQERAMELGFDWYSVTKKPSFVNEKGLIFGDNKDITFASERKYFDAVKPHKEIFESDLFDDTKLVEIPDEIKNFDGKVGSLPTPIQTLLVFRSVEQNLKFGVKSNVADSKISSLQDDNGKFFAFADTPEGTDFWYNVKNGRFKDFKEKYGIYGEKVRDIKLNIPTTATTGASKTLSKGDLNNIKIKINSDFDLALKIVEKLEEFGIDNTSGIRRKIEKKEKFISIWRGTGSYVGWFEDEDNFNDSDKKEIFPSDLGILSTTTSGNTSTALTEVQKNISKDNKITQIVIYNSVEKRNDTFSMLRSLYREIGNIASLINGATLDDFISFNFINGDGYTISETNGIFHGSSYDALFVDAVITKNEFFRAIFKNFPELDFTEILTLASEREVYEEFKKSSQSAISIGATPTTSRSKFSSAEIKLFQSIDKIIEENNLTNVSSPILEFSSSSDSKDYDLVNEDTGEVFLIRSFSDELGFQKNDVNKDKSKALFKDYLDWKVGQSAISTGTTVQSVPTSTAGLIEIPDKIKNFDGKVVSLPNPILELLVFRCNEQGIGSIPDFLQKDIVAIEDDKKNLFQWDKAPEGHLFWRKIKQGDFTEFKATYGKYGEKVKDITGTSTSTAQASTAQTALLTDLSNTKIWIGDNPELSKRVQERAMELGWDWWGGNKKPDYLESQSFLFGDNKKITNTDTVKSFDSFEDHKEIFASDLFGSASTTTTATQAQTSTPLTGEEKLNREFVADYDPLRKNYLLNSSTLKNDIEDLNALATLLPSFQEVKFAVEKATILKEMGRLQKKIDYKGFIESNESVSKGADLFTPQGLLKYYFTQTTQNPTAELQPPCELPTPNGAKSKLPLGAYLNVRSSQFKKWFGDWEKAYETDNYVNCSKMIDEETKEPKIFYHGVRKYIPSFGQMSNMGVGVVRPYGSFEPPNFPASYFADNESYANFYGGIAENMPKPSEGYKPFIYKVFMCVKNPISLLPLDFEISYKDLIDYILVAYGIRINVNSVLLKQLGEDMDKKHPIWVYIRRDIGLIETLKDYGYDALIQQGDIPVFDKSGNPVSDRSKFIKDTEYLSFYPNQIKSATVKKSFYFNFFNDIRFKKGGYVCI